MAISSPVKEWLIGVRANPAPATPLRELMFMKGMVLNGIGIGIGHLKSIVYSGEFANTAATTSPCLPPY